MVVDSGGYVSIRSMQRPSMEDSSMVLHGGLLRGVVVASDPQDCWPKEGKRGPESSPKVLRPSTRVVTVPFPLPREIEEKYSKSSRVVLFLGGALRAPPKRVLFEYFFEYFSSISSENFTLSSEN